MSRASTPAPRSLIAPTYAPFGSGCSTTQRWPTSFFYTRYARNKGKPNWYSVTAIVFVLQANGVYKASVPAVSLHLMMEQTDKRNSIYTGSSMYYPEHAKIVLLKQLLTVFFTAGNSPSL